MLMLDMLMNISPIC